MMRYLAVLGQNPELSLVELQAVYPKIKIITRSNETVIFESAEKIDLNRLGGTPKLAEILEIGASIKDIKKVITDELKKFGNLDLHKATDGQDPTSLSELRGASQKIFFGLSFYGNENRGLYNSLGKEIKTALKNTGCKVRWANSRELALSSVYIKTNKLLTRGYNFDIVFSPHTFSPHFPSLEGKCLKGKGVLEGETREGVCIAKTIAVQDFADYEFRDMRRPARDLYSGMTPPKLAKIMVNLSLSPSLEGETGEGVSSPSPFAKGDKGGFLDPFCGSGTFLMEAALLGYKNICGSDIAKKAVSNSQKNFSWLKEKYKLLDTRPPIVKLCDIKNISSCWNTKFASIATEPYLGQPVRGELSPAQAEKMQKELSGLYEIYLKNLSSVLEKNGTLVLIVPFFISGGKKIKINLELKKAGLAAVRPSILYSRPDQKIGREIYILKKI